MIAFDQEQSQQQASVASIKVLGIGGAGGNAINCMIEADGREIEFIAINTDAQALKLSQAQVKIQIGQKSTKGLGAGANPEVGKRAAEEDLDKIIEAVAGADIVFLAAGMGGGTGSGALPVIVKALKEKGILTIAIITKPFVFEGRRRCKIAEEATEKIKSLVDTLIIVPNQKLLESVDETVSMIEGFGRINEILNQSVRSISNIITKAGHINVDFADVREIMKDQGLAVMGTARASGIDRARNAALAAISSPLLENMSIAGARGVLLNITASANLKLCEISQAALLIYEQADPDANIILGSVIDETMGEEVSFTVIATGFVPQKQIAAVSATHTSAVVQEDSVPVVAAAVYTPASLEQSVVHAQQQVVSVIEPVIQVAVQVQAQSVAHVVEEVQQAQKKQESQVIVCSESRLESRVEPRIETKEWAHSGEKYQEKQQEKSESGAININDLDVPTFMRKQAKEKYHADN